MNTPRSNARQNKHNTRMLDSPERRRTPHRGQISQVSIPQPFQIPPPAPPAGPLQFNDSFLNNYVSPPPPPINPMFQPPVYQHLPPNLAQALAQLPPLVPIRGSRDRGRGHGRGRGHPPAHPSAQPINLDWQPNQIVHVPPIGVSIFHIFYKMT